MRVRMHVRLHVCEHMYIQADLQLHILCGYVSKSAEGVLKRSKRYGDGFLMESTRTCIDAECVSFCVYFSAPPRLFWRLLALRGMGPAYPMTVDLL